MLCRQRKLEVVPSRKTVVSVPEISRPRATIMDSLRPTEDEKTVGRERIKAFRVAQRTNWYQPTLWAVITEVANLPGHRHTLSPTAILRDLKARSLLFDGLSRQVLGNFFEGSPGNRSFKQYSLSRAAANNVYQASQSTRRGILVSLDRILCFSYLCGRRYIGTR